jgi:hypothetical protein
MTVILEDTPHDERMPQLFRSTSPLVAAGCAAAFLLPMDASVGAPPVSTDSAAELRAQGPAALTGLLARYDQLQPGRERDDLALTIDKVAAQRYATVSRLYWYTDLAQAEAAARTAHRPILALRMLGRLDEDLSCANSRLFRATLYANAGVSRLLRENFVLYWSSERPVPKVTIDMGDGRKIERTVTGNSAHYVLDENGQVLDVLPGLYAPSVFADELGKSLALATRIRTMSAGRRIEATVAFHSAALEKQAAAFRKLAGVRYPKGGTAGSQLASAQMATVSKMVREVPELAQIGIDAGTIAPDDNAQWAVIGERLWKLSGPQARTTGKRGLFDAPSEALIARLHAAATPAALAYVIARLEDTVVADTALDELRLRTQIRQYLIGSRVIDFETLNQWIYAQVFHTPKEDAWLGLLPRTDFTGLPGDGVVMP